MERHGRHRPRRHDGSDSINRRSNQNTPKRRHRTNKHRHPQDDMPHLKENSYNIKDLVHALRDNARDTTLFDELSTEQKKFMLNPETFEDCKTIDSTLRFAKYAFRILDKAYFFGRIRRMVLDGIHVHKRDPKRQAKMGECRTYILTGKKEIHINMKETREELNVDESIQERLIASLAHEMLHAFLRGYTCRCLYCVNAAGTVRIHGRSGHGSNFCSALVAIQDAMNRDLPWIADCGLEGAVEREVEKGGKRPTQAQLQRWHLDDDFGAWDSEFDPREYGESENDNSEHGSFEEDGLDSEEDDDFATRWEGVPSEYGTLSDGDSEVGSEDEVFEDEYTINGEDEEEELEYQVEDMAPMLERMTLDNLPNLNPEAAQDIVRQFLADQRAQGRGVVKERGYSSEKRATTTIQRSIFIEGDSNSEESEEFEPPARRSQGDSRQARPSQEGSGDHGLGHDESSHSRSHHGLTRGDTEREISRHRGTSHRERGREISGYHRSRQNESSHGRSRVAPARDNAGREISHCHRSSHREHGQESSGYRESRHTMSHRHRRSEEVASLPCTMM